MTFKTITAIAAISMAILTAGCSTVATPVAESTPAPASSYHMTPKAAAPELATVVFVRDTGLFGGAVDNHVAINGQKAVSLATGERATFNLPPDEYVFGVSRTDPFGGAGFLSIDQTLKAGKTYYYRIFTEGSSRSTSIQRFLP